MTTRRPFHVGYSPLTQRIYAGHVAKDGVSWREGKTDVTTEVLLAVVGRIRPGYRQALIATNGGPSYEIEVREIPTPASGIDVPKEPGSKSPAEGESPVGGHAETPHPDLLSPLPKE